MADQVADSEPQAFLYQAPSLLQFHPPNGLEPVLEFTKWSLEGLENRLELDAQGVQCARNIAVLRSTLERRPFMAHATAQVYNAMRVARRRCPQYAFEAAKSTAIQVRELLVLQCVVTSGCGDQRCL